MGRDVCRESAVLLFGPGLEGKIPTLTSNGTGTTMRPSAEWSWPRVVTGFVPGKQSATVAQEPQGVQRHQHSGACISQNGRP